MEKRNKMILMVTLPVIPNLLGAASGILKLTHKAEQLARVLHTIAKLLCLPICLVSAFVAAFTSQDDEYQSSRITALWISFMTVLTYLVFPDPEEE